MNRRRFLTAAATTVWIAGCGAPGDDGGDGGGDDETGGGAYGKLDDPASDGPGRPSSPVSRRRSPPAFGR
ncbi:MAG: hypothetical protein ABEJ73_10810 [Haloplanus sp.]